MDRTARPSQEGSERRRQMPAPPPPRPSSRAPVPSSMLSASNSGSAGTAGSSASGMERRNAEIQARIALKQQQQQQQQALGSSSTSTRTDRPQPPAVSRSRPAPKPRLVAEMKRTDSLGSSSSSSTAGPSRQLGRSSSNELASSSSIVPEANRRQPSGGPTASSSRSRNRSNEIAAIPAATAIPVSSHHRRLGSSSSAASNSLPNLALSQSPHRSESAGSRGRNNSVGEEPSSRRLAPPTRPSKAAAKNAAPPISTSVFDGTFADSSLQNRPSNEDLVRLRNESAAKSPAVQSPLPEFLRVSDSYRAGLVSAVQSLGRALPPPSKSDFLTEDGYRQWRARGEQQGLAPIVANMLQLWDLDHALLSEEHLQKRTNVKEEKVAHFKPFATTVNLVLRIIEAQGFSLDHKGRARNCVAVIEYGSKNGPKEPTRFETSVIPNTTEPDWNEQVTLTIHDLSEPITITVFHRKEKSGIFGDDVRDEFLGAIRLKVQDLVTHTVKNGFLEEWYQLNNTDSKEKYRNKPASGEIHLEVEMGGILNEQSTESLRNSSGALELSADLQKLKDLEHRLITYKVNLKSMFAILLDAIVTFDLCVAPGKDLSRIRVKEMAPGLSKEGVFVLRQFGHLWTISDVFRKMKYLECVFKRYKEQRLHARVVTTAYKTLYESVWKRGTVWLPAYEKPVLFDLLAEIESHLTDQIRNFKEYFPPPSPPSNTVVEYITTSIDCIILLTRMIDKNPFFLKEVEGARGLDSQKSPDAESRSSNGSLTAGLNAAISELDYLNGQFSFTEKLKGILQSRVISRYQRLSEIASPAVGEETLEATLVKCRELSKLMLADVEEDKQIYRKAFSKEQIDILPITIDTYLQYFVLENENLAHFHRIAKKQGYLPSAVTKVASSEDEAGEPLEETIHDDLPRTEEQVLTVAFELMENVRLMKQRWTKYAKTMPIDLPEWFAPFIHRWLVLSENKTLEWVEKAIAVDTFEATPRDANGNSNTSSVTDLFTAIFQALAYMQNLTREWPNEVQYARFITRFAKIAYKALTNYCKALETKDKDEVTETMNKLLAEMSVANAGAMQSVKRWFGGVNAAQGTDGAAAKDPTEEIAERVDISVTSCVRLCNLEAINKKLGSLYREMKGQDAQKVAEKWRTSKAAAKKAKEQQSGSDAPVGICGSLKVQAVAAEDLKARSMISSKTSPYIVVSKIQATGDPNPVEVYRTKEVHGTWNPLYEDWNPEVNKVAASMNMRRRKAFPFIYDPNYGIAAVQDCTGFQVSVYHKADASSNFQYFTGGDTLLGQGNVTMKELELLKSKRDVLLWIDLSPQGRVLIRLQQLADGFLDATKASATEEGLDFGPGGVEDIDHWFVKMEASLNMTRNTIVGMMVDLIASAVEPLMLRTLTKPTSMGSKEMTSLEAEQALRPVMDYLNENFSQLSQSLPGTMAQHAIYRIWLNAIMRTMVHLLVPLHYCPDYASSSFGNNLLQRQLDVRQWSALRKWAPQLLAFFHADGVGLGLPTSILQEGCRWYNDLQTLLPSYAQPTKELVTLAKARCTNNDGKWALMRLLRGRILWEGNAASESLKSAWKELYERRLQILKRNQVIL